MKKIKKLIKVLVVLAVVLVLVVILALSQINRIAASAVRIGATNALGVETTVESINIALLSEQCEINKLHVDSPEGFAAPSFLDLGYGSVGVHLGSLLKDTVHVPHFTLQDIDIYLEKKNGKMNYQAILGHLKKSESAETEKTEKPSPDQAPGKGFVVDKLTIKNVNAHINLGLDILQKPIRINQIVLENVGSNTPKGIVLEELTGVIIKAVLQAIVENSAELFPDMVKDLSQGLGELKALSDVGGQALNQLGTVADDVTKNAVKTLDQLDKEKDEILKDLGGLFGKDKKNK